jgi:hypothetical protein
MGANQNSQGNSAYIPNLTQHISLLTRSRPYSYGKAIGPRNPVRNPRITVEYKMVQANPQPMSPPTSHEKRDVADVEDDKFLVEGSKQIQDYDMVTQFHLFNNSYHRYFQ